MSNPTRECSVDGCSGKYRARGMCASHYGEWYRNGGSESVDRSPGKKYAETCSVEGCRDPCHCKGKCRKHYNADYHLENRDRLLKDMSVRSRAYYLANRELVLERTRKRQRENPEQHRKWARDQYRRDPARGAALKADRRARNIEIYRARDSEYARNHPHKMRMKTAKRRALKLKNGVFSVLQRDLDRLLSRFQHQCAYCARKLGDDLEWDHVMPLSRGGRHSIGNLVPSCEFCNGSKGALTVTEWRLRDRRRGTLSAAN